MQRGRVWQGAASSLVSVALLTVAGCDSGAPAPPPATTSSPAAAPPTERVVGPLTEADAKALATMNDRLKEYLEIRNQAEQSLPGIQKDATPEQIDQRQRELLKALQKARATAKQGNIFTPEARPVITRLLATVFGGPDGKEMRASIMDENPLVSAGVKRTVNGVYPDTVPLSTVPPEVLQTLPKLTEDLEYRFIGDSLILLDADAHLILDFIDDAIPR